MIELPITIVDLLQRGIPDKECIVFKAHEDVNRQNFLVGLGLPDSNGGVVPINDNMFWMGGGLFLNGDWIYLYTGSGQPETIQAPNQDYRIHTLFWKRRNVLFKSNEIVPFVLEAQNVSIGKPSNGLKIEDHT